MSKVTRTTQRKTGVIVGAESWMTAEDVHRVGDAFTRAFPGVMFVVVNGVQSVAFEWEES